MCASKFAKILGLGLTALLAAACDNKSNDPPPPPPPGATDLLAAIGSMDASYVTDTKFWNHWKNADAVDPTVSAGTYAGMTGDCLQATSTNWGTEAWHVQFAAGNTTDWNGKVFTLQEGKQYTIQLKGAASASSTIQVVLQDDGASTNATQLDVPLTATTQTFTSTPFAPDAATPVRFMVNAGGLAADTVLYLDDVQLLEEDVP